MKTVEALHEELKPRIDVFKNVKADPTQPFIVGTVKLACGPEYTRIGDILANELSQELIAFILKVYAFPGCPHDEAVYV